MKPFGEKLIEFYGWMNANAELIGAILGLVGYGLIWYFYSFKLALLIFLVMFANNLEQMNRGRKR